MKAIKDMTTEELKEYLKELRNKRKVGYTTKPRRRETDIIDSISPELAEEILKKLGVE